MRIAEATPEVLNYFAVPADLRAQLDAGRAIALADPLTEVGAIGIRRFGKSPGVDQVDFGGWFTSPNWAWALPSVLVGPQTVDELELVSDGTQRVLLDLGPHLLDLLDAAVGPVVSVRATGDSRRWIELTCEHESGAVSQASLSGAVRLPRGRTRVELYGEHEELVYDTAEFDLEEGWPVLRREFATAVREGRSPDTDARRGLRLQELLAQALDSSSQNSRAPR